MRNVRRGRGRSEALDLSSSLVAHGPSLAGPRPAFERVGRYTPFVGEATSERRGPRLWRPAFALLGLLVLGAVAILATSRSVRIRYFSFRMRAAATHHERS